MTTTRTERVSMAAVRERARELEVQRIEDVEHLLGSGIHSSVVAVRAGFPSEPAASRYFYRHGRPDLTRRFDQQHRKNEELR